MIHGQKNIKKDFYHFKPCCTSWTEPVLTFEVANENRQTGGKETNLRELLLLNMKQVYGVRPRVLTIILLRPAGLSSASKFSRGSVSLPSSEAKDYGILRVSLPARHCAAW